MKHNKFGYRIIIILCLFSFCININSQELLHSYREAFSKINNMLSVKDTLNFKDAVFFTEDAYSEKRLSKETYNSIIRF